MPYKDIKDQRAASSRWAMNNRNKVRASSAKYEASHKDVRMPKLKALMRKRREDWLRFIGPVVCSRCGFSGDFCALDAHHLDPETKEIGIAVLMSNYSCTSEHQEKLNRELKKCIWLCANCHRIEHHKN